MSHTTINLELHDIEEDPTTSEIRRYTIPCEISLSGFEYYRLITYIGHVQPCDSS